MRSANTSTNLWAVCAYSRLPYEEKNGSPFFPGRRLGRQSGKASSSPLRTPLRDHQQKCAGNGLRTWREQPMRTPSMWPPMRNEKFSIRLFLRPPSLECPCAAPHHNDSSSVYFFWDLNSNGGRRFNEGMCWAESEEYLPFNCLMFVKLFSYSCTV